MVSSADLVFEPRQVQLVSGFVIDASGNRLTIKRAFANIAASTTDGTFTREAGGGTLPATTGYRTRVLWVVVVAGATATNLTFNSKPTSSAGVAISPLLANNSNGGEVLPPNHDGWFQTASGEQLTVTTGAGATTGILIGYVEVPV